MIRTQRTIREVNEARLRSEGIDPDSMTVEAIESAYEGVEAIEAAYEAYETGRKRAAANDEKRWKLPTTHREAAQQVGQPSAFGGDALLGQPGSRVRRIALHRMLTTTLPGA